MLIHLVYKKTFLALILAMLLAASAFAEMVRMSPLSMPSAASNGFGGSHVAYTDNVFSLLVNPAAMMRTRQKSFFTLAPSFYSPQSMLEIGSSIMDMVSSGNFDGIGELAETFSRNNGRMALGLELREFPFSIAWVADGFGFGLWNRSFARLEIVGNSVRAVVYSDFMLPVGFAFRVLDTGRHSIDAGFTLKPFVRIRAEEQEFITDLLDSEDYEFDTPIPVIAGGSFDIGLLYRRAGGFQAGLTFTDIHARGTVVANLTGTEDTRGYYIPFAVNAGVAQCIRFTKNIVFTAAADWRDMGNIFNQDDYLNARNFLLDFGLGVQLAFFDVFFVRIGMNELLPAAGFGIHLGAVKIDVAYYGREFGYEPQMLPAAALDLSISIRPRARERNWIWTRASALGLLGVGR